MHYAESPPRAELRSVVRCFWELRGPGDPYVPERVIPDGCTEVVLNRAESFRRFAEDGSSRRQSHLLLVGLRDSAVSQLVATVLVRSAVAILKKDYDKLDDVRIWHGHGQKFLKKDRGWGIWEPLLHFCNPPPCDSASFSRPGICSLVNVRGSPLSSSEVKKLL